MARIFVPRVLTCKRKRKTKTETVKTGCSVKNKPIGKRKKSQEAIPNVQVKNDDPREQKQWKNTYRG